VYADWLEEQRDPENLLRAEYLRLDCELDGLAKKSWRRRKVSKRLHELEPQLGREWWRWIDTSPIEECSFALECPKRWNTLEPTADPAVRHCSQCDQPVYYCLGVGEARNHAAQGRCVAVDMRVRRWRDDLRPRQHIRMGRVMPTTRRRIPLADRKPATARKSPASPFSLPPLR
jgi:hypothetical protein